MLELGMLNQNFLGGACTDPDIVSKLFLLRKRIVSRRHAGRPNLLLLMTGIGAFTFGI